jgi:D-glycero-D-manno-heptose 1,7-bisphosphate phosphatase
MSRPAVFLDRDGTLIEDVGYVDRLERLQLYPWSLESVRLLRRSGYAVVVVTNQAGVARGFVREQAVTDVFDLIQEQLAAIGERLDGHYYCPHLVDAPVESYRRSCSCHKPLPGMVEQAVAALDLDVSRSYVVGDRWTDVQLARAVGAKAVLVQTGYGATQLADPPLGETADAVHANLLEAVGWVLSQPVVRS